MKDFLNRHRTKLWIAQAVGLLLIGLFVGLSMRGGTLQTEASVGDEHSGRNAPDKVAEIWTCSMHPQIRRDGPGKCPLCGMDLVPVKKSAGGVRTISISPDVLKLMNVQTVPVAQRYVTAEVRMVGKIDYDETRLAHVTAWVSGR